jgi:predicted regulator of Ras-like GTPase activity (Roadblock/LC7/MglB family)
VITDDNARGGEIRRLLEEMLHASGSLVCLLISREGVCLGQAGGMASLNSTALAALVAGMFAATKEVATMVGENQFSILLQQGDKRHIHISLVGRRAMMVVVFEDYTRTGRVRLEAKKTGEAVAEIMDAPVRRRDGEDVDISLPRFREFALNLVDQIFRVDEEDDAPHQS